MHGCLFACTQRPWANIVCFFLLVNLSLFLCVCGYVRVSAFMCVRVYGYMSVRMCCCVCICVLGYFPLLSFSFWA